MFTSISQLKTEPTSLIHTNPLFPDFTEEYQHIVDICQDGAPIPQVSQQKSFDILKSLKKDVNDFYSITPLHFLNAGETGIRHFHFLFNTVISNINTYGLAELNTIYAVILFKGHGKDKENSRSYRTISTCPLLAKAIDLYVRELSLKGWNEDQAPTQYQGGGMSHELASLLLTETIQHSLNVSKRPVYALFLDARSAFDRVVKEILIRNLFNCGVRDHRLIYLNQRLGNRRTFVDYDKNLMGPILDTRGLEQGGISSSDEFKLYNNEQARIAHESNLGVAIGNFTISCVSLADDATLLANSIYDLHNLLKLTLNYCEKYDVELVPEKIQLVAFHNSKLEDEVKIAKQTFHIDINGRNISFDSHALHLGVFHHEKQPNNMSCIVDRQSAHRRQLFSLLPAGMALRHSGNPEANLRVERIFCVPVLLSGLASLVLSQAEVNALSFYYKNTLTRLMKLFDRTPDCAIYFLSGSIPVEGMLHLRQLSLFSMICHLDDNILKELAFYSLVCSTAATKSWFQQIRNLCIKYNLPDALHLLSYPLPKEKFKNMCKLNVLEFWRVKLTNEARNLPSLRFLNTSFLSLSSPHPIWTSLDGNPFQAKAACIQALFLSGRYRTEKLCRFWSSNKAGYCLLEPCNSQKILEGRKHVLLHCFSFSDNRRRLVNMVSSIVAHMPALSPIFDKYLYQDNDDLTMQFLLDCSSLPLVIAARQFHGDIVYRLLFKFTRTWCQSIHRSRLKLLGRTSYP